MRPALLMVFTVAAISGLSPQPVQAASPTAMQDRDDLLYQRYLKILLRSPRQGTAFDKVVDYHQQRKTLDQFAQQLAQTASNAATDAEAGAALLLAGMIREQQTEYAAAAAAFAQAAKLRPADATAAWYHGAALMADKQFDAATVALESALTRKPSRPDELEIYQALGRLYQQTRQVDKAVAIYKRLEAAFPRDRRVQESIAEVLLTGGLLSEALQRYDQLAANAERPQQAIEYALQAAEIETRQNNHQAARQRLTSLAQKVRPGSYLHDRIQRQLQQSYLADSDFDGLIQHYQSVLQRDPTDVQAMQRLASAFLLVDRAADAEQQLRRAVELAPTDAKLRQQFIQVLLRQNLLSAAISQYESLAELTSLSFEQRAAWGRLILKQPDVPPEQRKMQARTVWSELSQSAGDDPVAVVRLANLYRSAEMPDDAQNAFERAVRLAPDDDRFHEYLGEFFHAENRPAKAIAAWKQMAEGPRQSADTLLNLVGVLQRYEYQLQALQTMHQLAEQHPSLQHHLKYAEMLRDAGQSETALQQIDRAAVLATAEQESQVTEQRILALRDSGQLRSRALQLRRQLQNSAAENWQDWRTVALYFETLGDITAASEAISRSISKSETSQADSTEVLKAAVRIFERGGALDRAAQAAAQLAQQDAAFRSLHLKDLLRLQADLGRREELTETARRLIAAAPDNEDNYRYAADLLLRLGEQQTALNLLQRATSNNSAGIDLLRQYGETLATLFRTDEAIRVYWRVFERVRSDDERLQVARRLAKIYGRADRFAELQDKLQQQIQVAEQPAGPLRILAAALQEVGRLAAAEQMLQRAVQTVADDPDVWAQLADVAQRQNNFAAAAEYQQRVTELEPSLQATEQLAMLLQQAGRLSAEEADWLKYSHSNRSAAEVLALVDRLLLDGKVSLARRLISRRLSRTPDQWEFLLRKAIVDRQEGKTDPMQAAVRKLLQLQLRNDSPARQSVLLRAAKQQPDLPRAVRIADRLDRMTTFVQTSKQPANEEIPWAATDLHEAAAVAILLQTASLQEDAGYSDLLQMLAQQPSASAWRRWSAAHAWQRLRRRSNNQHTAILRAAAKALAAEGGPEASFAWLHFLSQQPQPADPQLTVNSWRIIAEQQPDWLLTLDNPAVVLQGLQSQDAVKTAQLRADLRRPDATAAALQVALLDAEQQQDWPGFVNLAVRLNQFSDEDNSFARRLSMAAWQAAQREDTQLARQIVQSFLSEQVRTVPARAQPEDLHFSISTNFRLHHKQNRPAIIRDTALAFDEHWPRSDVEFLVNAREAFRRLEGFDLAQQVQAFADTAPDDDANGNYVQYVAATAFGHLKYLEGDQSAALKYLVRAAAQWPANETLRLRLARHYRSAGYPRDALRLLDTCRSSAHDLVAAREFLALEIASELKQADRLQQAAERLLGLRLPPDQATRLTERLTAAGLAQLAGRLRQRSDRFNDDLPRLVRLLDDAVADEDVPVAAEVAHQILSLTQGMTRGPKHGRSLPAIRSDAIRAVDSAQQLDRLLETIDRQLQDRPADVRLLEQKLEILTAVDRTQDAAQVRQRLQAAQPLSVDRLLKQAAEFERVRNDRAACDLLLQVLERDPQRFSGNYYQYLKTFTRAGRTAELADALMQHDLRKLQNNHYVVNEVIQALFAASDGDRQHQTSQKALQLFEAAWKAFPTNRTFLLTEIDDPRVWRLPLMLDYARTALIPQTVQQAAANPWKVITGRLQAAGPNAASGRRVEATVTRFVQAVRQQDRVPEFRRLTKEAVDRFPLWSGGKLLLAILQHSDHDDAAAAATFSEVMAAMGDTPVPPDAALLVAQEIHESAASDLQQIIVELLAAALRESPAPVARPYRQTAGAELVERLAKLNRKSAALRAAKDAFERIDFEALSTAAGDKSGIREQALQAASQLLELKYPLAAAERLHQYNLLVEPSRLKDSAAAVLPRSQRQLHSRVRSAIRRSMQTPHLIDALHPADDSAANHSDPLIYVDQNGKLQSDFLNLLRQQLQRDPDAIQQLQALAKQHSTDLFVNAASLKLGKSLPVPELSDLSQQNLRTIFESTDQQIRNQSTAAVLLWLAVRSEFRSPPTPFYEQLADQALQSTELLGRPEWTAAILDEQGELALQRGDRAAGEAAWSRLLDVVLADGSNSKTSDAAATSSTATEAIYLLRETLLQPAGGAP